MFSMKQALAYCCEPLERIKGFKEASESSEKYHIHHRFEEMGLSRKDLIEMDLLYHRPACELVFMNGWEHNVMHSKLFPSDKYALARYQIGNVPAFTEAHRKHISEAKKGVKQTPEHTLHVVEACAPIRASKEFKEKMSKAQIRRWTPERRAQQSATTRRVWETNVEFRETLKRKANIIIHKDLEEYKKYKAAGGELSWKPFRAWLAKQRKSK